MNFLIISGGYPQPDKASGDLRFFTLLLLLARRHKLTFCALSPGDCTIVPRNDYGVRLEQEGIALASDDLFQTLKCFKPDIVWFEFYHQVHPNYLALLKRHCPYAKVVVDSVDVHFNRLEARARLTGKIEDETAAQELKSHELAAYANADMVLAVSEEDKQLIKRELPGMSVEVIPNVHDLPPFPDMATRQHGELIFVGGFKHDPNIDAMLYFCREIMPSIVAKYPRARLKIIGSHPPPLIEALASNSIEILGYVPDTSPHLKKAYISVAPLRYGGGMKGKVGEAMSYGLPVVTTSFGAEGFGLQPGQDLLVGETAESFAAQVIALLDDRDLYERTARHGYQFIEQHYSVPVVEQRIESAMQRLSNLPPRGIPLHRRLIRGFHDGYIRHVAWRYKKL